MALSPGTRLGHYTVSALIGEGGMGQVWQATDTQLNRQVALKILPDAFADDPDRLARFQREAQVLASLNHPNIAAIHGIEEAEGTRALVLELVEGPTLADRIAKGPIPVDEALPIAKQIAEALFKEALKRLNPLVADERKLAEKQQVSIENRATRRRLDKLERAAADFMDQDRDDETSREPTAAISRKLREAGYVLSPPFKQFVKGESTRCSLTVVRSAFPEIEAGASVQVECQTEEIKSDYRVVGLDRRPTDENLLEAIWNVTAVGKTSATGIRVSVGPIRAEATFEVFEDAKEQYAHVKDLQFSHNRYRVSSEGKKKKIRLYCPIEMVSGITQVDISFSNKKLTLGGAHSLVRKAKLGIAVCDFTVSSSKAEVVGKLTARVGSSTATAEVFTEPPKGAGIKIKLQPVSFGNDRSLWRHNVLELAAKHPSLSRYLGPQSENFPGQDSRHFRLLIAEVVADSVCSKLIEYRERKGEYVDEERDWNFYYAVHSELMTQFLPIAHQLQVADVSS
jgi:hypothetical protein